MTLDDILNQLSVGELSQLALGERDATGNLSEKNRRTLVTHINMGLTALHRKFVLKHKDAVIELQPNQLRYVLDKKYAASNTESTEPVKYIADLNNPFENVVMQIEAVTDDLGNDIPLDNTSRQEAIRRTDYRTLVLPPTPKDNRFKHLLDYSETMTVLYRANHERLTETDVMAAPESVMIDLPDTHLEVLVLYIASRAMNPIGMSDTFHAGNNYAGKFEAACQQLKDDGFGLSEPGQGVGFRDNGWA